MPIYDETTTSARYLIGRAYDETATGTRYQIGKIYDETTTGVRSLIYQSTLDIFNPTPVGWVTHQGTVTIESTTIAALASGVNQFSAARTASPIDLSGFATLKATATLQESSYGGYVYIAISTDIASVPYTQLASWKTVGVEQEQAVSLAGYQGAYYLWFVCWSDSALGRGYMKTMFAE